MLTEIFQYLRNWFEKTKIFSEFAISGGSITFADGKPLPITVGQFFRVSGSALNDGVYRFGDDDLQAQERFSGAVWVMAVPPAVVTLAEEIEEWTAANADAINSPYQSESFGGYSYSLKSGTAEAGWRSQFAARLAPWRKI